MIKLYGIKNCDTMKKARQWLDAHGVDYEFHDYKVEGVDTERLRGWFARIGWEALLNRRGSTWRQLDEATRERMDEETALRVMLESPSIIKRPVIEDGDKLLVGFDDRAYAERWG